MKTTIQTHIWNPALWIISVLIVLVFAPSSLYATDYVIISEVMYDTPLNEQIATGAIYSNGEYVELYNAGNDWVSLDGWRLKGGGATEVYYFPSNTVLAPNSYLIVAYQYNNSDFTLDQLYDGFTTSHHAQVQYQRKVILSNSGEALKLINLSGTTKDSVYIDGTINKTKPYRLSAANTDSLSGNSCVSLQRSVAVFDNSGIALTNNQEWYSAAVSPFVQNVAYNLPADPYIPESPNYGNSSYTNGQNYILTRNYTDVNAGAALDQIQYFDALGRPVQTVQKAITPNSADLITYIEYDSVGREIKQWLPIVSSGGGFVNINSFTSGSSLYNNDSHAYTETHYEASPLNRVDWRQGPGSAWQNHPVGTSYGTNVSSDVKYFTVSGTSLQNSGYYGAAALYKTTITDEDGKPTIEYKDKLGQVIMKRVITNEAGNHDTYYVYNDLGQLCYVLPPLAADASGSADAINKYGYVYRYDARGNCTYKKLPGCEPVTMTYYPDDLLMTSQDGNQLAKSEWLHYEYDGVRRLIRTSLVSSSGTVVLTENYYDNYNFIGTLTTLNFVTENGYDGQHNSAKGLLTGTRTYSLNDIEKCTITALYYDYQGRVVQTRSSNYLGGYDLEYKKISFIGKVLMSEQIHSVANDYPPGNADFSFTENKEIYIYDYDHAGRLTNTYRNGQLYTTQKYNNLGQLTEKITLSGIDTTAYTYNIRGWMKDINGTHFSQNLYYNDPIAGADACYNGNISAMKWKSAGETEMRGYTFEYNNLNRLLNANYGEGDNLQAAIGRFNEELTYDKMGNIMFLKRYGVSSKYNNNFLYNLINDLEYSYSGNQLKTVDDHAEEEESVVFEGVADFKDRSNASKQYSYDANGNMTKDLNKGIDTIRYNLLNLPQEIVFANGDRSLYKYNATGTKYQVIHYTHIDTELNPVQGNGEAQYKILTYDYDGSYVYRDHYFNMLMTPGGYVHFNEFTGEICFYAKDHLGNNRATYYVTPITELGVLVKDINNYYPFGMEFNEKPVVFNVGFNPELDFTYNGKESQTMHGLNMMDYGARFIDMANPGWIGVDPLAEKYYSISPYAYCAGNPVNRIDPDGKQIFGLNIPFSPLLGVSDPILLSNKPVATETMARVGRATTETVSKTSEATSSGSKVPKLEVKGLEKSLNESNKTNNSGEKGTTTFTEKVRPTKGADGSTSKHLIESDSKGNTISKTHQVTNEQGKIIHQHQDHIPQNLPQGEKAIPRRFPDEWIMFPQK